MSYRDEGTLTTDKREVDETTSWDSTEEWEEYESRYGINIENGVLKLAESLIPDSAVHRWKLDESGDTASDSIGSADLTHSGPTEVTDTWQGGSAREYDGSDDESTADSSLSQTFGDGNGDFSVAVTLEPASLSDTQHILTHQPDANNAEGFQMSLSNESEGTVDFGTRGSDGTSETQVSVDISGLDDRVRIVAEYDDSESSAEIFANVDEESATDGNANFYGDEYDFRIGGDAGVDYYDGIVDDVILYDEKLGSSGRQDDYDEQPWT